MSLTSHTKEYGTSEVNELVELYLYGNDGNNPVDSRDYAVYEKLHSSRYPSSRSSDLDSAGRRSPKSYSWIIAKVTEYRPFVSRDTGYSDFPKRDLIRSHPHPDFSCHTKYPPDDWFAQDVVNAANTKALLSLRNRSSLQLGADIGESHKTLSMIASRTTQVLSAYKAARDFRFGAIPKILGVDGRSLRSLRAPADVWLEYQYGWKPLMSSIHSGIDLLKDGFRRPQIYRATGSASNTTEWYTYPNGQKRTYNASYRVKTVIDYKVANATVDLLDRAGVVNPLSIAWELTPFSFVLDWFVPVGNVLGALTATAGLEFVSGWRNEWWDIKHHTYQDSWYPGYEHYSLVDPGFAEAQNFQFFRVPLGGFPSPGLYTNAHPFSTTHVVNALALLRQLF